MIVGITTQNEDNAKYGFNMMMVSYDSTLKEQPKLRKVNERQVQPNLYVYLDELYEMNLFLRTKTIRFGHLQMLQSVYACK